MGTQAPEGRRRTTAFPSVAFVAAAVALPASVTVMTPVVMARATAIAPFLPPLHATHDLPKIGLGKDHGPR